jgi:hypothetical protein
LFLAAVFVAGILCAVAITAVACMNPEGSDAHQALDACESHSLEALTH